MAKSSGGTKVSSSGGAGRGATQSIRGWQLGTDSYGLPAVRASGQNARILYSAIQSPVERAVESGIGSIRTGGGYSGAATDNTEYTLIFANGTTSAQINKYLKGMTEGSKLYARYNDRDLSDAEHAKAEEAFEKWYRKTNKA